MEKRIDVSEHEDATPIDNMGISPTEQTEKSEPENKPTEKKPSKKLVVSIACVVLLLAGGAAAYLLTKKSVQKSQEQLSQTTQQDFSNSGFFGPTLISFESTNSQAGDCLKRTEKLISKSIENTDISAEKQLLEGLYISWHVVSKNHVAVVSEPGCGSDAKLTIWYSNTGGRTFDAVFEGSGLGSDNMLGDQITSIVLSPDGKSLIFALLPGSINTPNSIKEIDLETRKVTDLFTSDSGGVFLEGYDRVNQKLYYFAGCYNCDGSALNKLFVRDLKTNVVGTVFDDTERIGERVAISSDFKKLLLLHGVAGEFLGAGPPYTITEYDLATNAGTELLKTNEAVTDVGYRNGDNHPYYVMGNKILSLKNTGENATIFEADGPIIAVYYHSTDKILADTGEFNNGHLFVYDVATKAIKDLGTTTESFHAIGLATE